MKSLGDRTVSDRNLVVPDKILVATDLGDLDYFFRRREISRHVEEAGG